MAHRTARIVRMDSGTLLILGLFGFSLIAFVVLDTFHPLAYRIEGVDPVGYYAWAHSILFDRDLQFENEYRALNTAEVLRKNPLVNPEGERTPTGHLGNAFSIGPGLLWAPFLIVAHGVAWLHGAETDGFSQPYHAAVFIANLCYGLAGVLLTYLALRTWFERRASAIAAAAAWAGSPALYYTFPQEAMSHACSLFSIALLLFLWARLRDKPSPWVWAVIGAAAGMAALVRWQDATFAIIPAMDLLWRDRRRAWVRLVLYAAAATVVFLPQMLAWKVLYGSFLTVPQGASFMSWTRPDFIRPLFSPMHGLVTWTPLCGVGLAGLFFYPKEHRRVFVPLVGAVILQLYVEACAGNVGWSFGMRRLVNCVPLFAVGLCHLQQRCHAKPKWSIVIASVFALWNFLFVLQYAGFLNEYYVTTALVELAHQHQTTPVTLVRARRFPDGRSFDPGQFAQAHVFPRDHAPTLRQFVWDKGIVLREIARRLVEKPL